MTLIALLLVALMATTAIVVDLGNARQQRRQAASGADAGALAGAQALTAMPTTPNGCADPTCVAAYYTASSVQRATSGATLQGSRGGCTIETAGTGETCWQYSAGDATIAVKNPYSFNGAAASTDYLHVKVCWNVATTFARVIGSDKVNVCGLATARKAIPAGKTVQIAILVLGCSNLAASACASSSDADHNLGSAFSCSGNCDVEVGSSAIADNSTATGNQSALNLSGTNASMNAAQIHVVGGTNGTPTCTDPVSPCPTDHARTTDPFAGLAPPSQPAATLWNGSSPLLPGYYSQAVNLSGSTVVCPGIYYFTAGVSQTNSNASTDMGTAGEGGCPANGADGVLFYVASNDLTINGGTFHIAAMKTGAWQGIAIFQARTNKTAMALAGGGSIAVNGLVYAPSAQLTLAGSTSSTDGVLQADVNQLKVTGGARLGSAYCDVNVCTGGTPPIPLALVE